MQWIWGWCFMEKAVRLRKVFSATVVAGGRKEVLERLVGSGRRSVGGDWAHGLRG